jgi:hypothetical protein
MMGNWDGSPFGFVLILSGITAAVTSRGVMLRGFSGTIAPYLLLMRTVLTFRSVIIIF